MIAGQRGEIEQRHALPRAPPTDRGHRRGVSGVHEAVLAGAVHGRQDADHRQVRSQRAHAVQAVVQVPDGLPGWQRDRPSAQHPGEDRLGGPIALSRPSAQPVRSQIAQSGPQVGG